jgi:hypothetical protein
MVTTSIMPPITPPQDLNSETPISLTLSLANTVDGDFRTAIINELNFSRTANSNATPVHRFSEMNEFYYCRSKIEGFALDYFSMSRAGYRYVYAPIIRRNDERLNHDNVVQIIIRRTDYMPEGRNAFEHFEVSVIENNMTLIGENIAYAGDGDIYGIVGNSYFRISAPVGMRDQETLIALARDLISTAELINVDEEIGRLAAE